MKFRKLSDAVIALSITIALLLLLTSPLWIGWMMEHEYNKTHHALADVALSCPQGAMEKREVWSKLGIAVFCEIDGVKHGVWQAWDGGYMHIAGEYMHGKKHGIWKYLNAYGEQWGTRTYAADKEVSGLVNLLIAESLLLKIRERKLYLIKHGKRYRSYKARLATGRMHPDDTLDIRHIPQGTYVLDSKVEDSKGRKSMHVSISDEPKQNATAWTDVEFTIYGQQKFLGWIWQRLGLQGFTGRRVAVNNKDMDEIWGLVEIDTPMRVSP